MVRGGPGPISGILSIVTYPVTGSDMWTRAFTTSVSVYENRQKNLGDSIHTIGSTRSIQIIIKLFSASDGTT